MSSQVVPPVRPVRPWGCSVHGCILSRLSKLIERFMVQLLGTPQAIKRLHFWHIVEGIASLPLMVTHLLLLTFLSDGSLNIHEAILMFSVVAVPVLLTGLRLPTLVRLERICSSIVRTLEGEGEPVAERIVQLLWCRASQDQRIFSLLVVCWYALGLAWQARKAPCEDEAVSRLMAAECGIFFVSCVVLLISNVILCLAALLAPAVVCMCTDNFTPPNRRGIPKAMLDQLPVYTFRNRPDSESSPAKECVICFDEFEPDHTVRRLPCGHEFHSACVDSWLGNNPSCPLRCAVDIWAAVHAAAASPSPVASSSISDNRSPVAASISAASTANDGGSCPADLEGVDTEMPPLGLEESQLQQSRTPPTPSHNDGGREEAAVAVAPSVLGRALVSM